MQDQKVMQRLSQLRIIKLLPIAAAMSFLLQPVYAETYNTVAEGNYNDETIWEPSFPGTKITEKHMVIINHKVNIYCNLLVEGTIKIGKEGELNGNKGLMFLKTSKVQNFGVINVAHITNRGKLINHNSIEVANEIINTGMIKNNANIVVQDAIENIGTISGNGGSLKVYNTIFNVFGGYIGGSLDICADKFSNTDGASIDSVSLSFCGNRIFTGTFLTASLHKNRIELNLVNLKLNKYKYFEVLRSTDNSSFKPIGKLKSKKLKKLGKFLFIDKKYPNDEQTIYYKVKMVAKKKKKKKEAPVISVSNVFHPNFPTSSMR